MKKYCLNCKNQLNAEHYSDRFCDDNCFKAWAKRMKTKEEFLGDRAIKKLIVTACKEKVDNLKRERDELKETMLCDRESIKSEVGKLSIEVKKEIKEYREIINSLI